MLKHIIREQRISKGLSIKDVAARMGIDPSLMSRYERGERLPTQEHIAALSEVFALEKETLLRGWLEEKVFGVLNTYPDLAPEVLRAMESRVEYLSGPNYLKQPAPNAAVRALLDSIDALRTRWLAKKPLSETQLQKMRVHFSLSNTYESNRIEGNTLTLQETFLVVQEGLTIGGKTLHEHLEAINHQEALEFIGDMVSGHLALNEFRLRQIHQLVLKGIDRQNAGIWRKVPVRIGGSSHIPPEPWQIPKLMEDYFVFYEQNAHKLHPVVLAAEMHERLVSIHPFIDGNGRTSRLVMNLILLQHGYTLATLKGSPAQRTSYYKALEAVQKNSNPSPFYKLICKAVKESLAEHLYLAGDTTPESV
jgi:Fic family protein